MASKKKLSGNNTSESNQEIPVNLSEADSKRLLKELQLKEIELELKNDQLLKINADLEKTLKNYVSIFNTSIAYLVVDAEGKIKDANLPALNLLRADAETLRNNNITNFLTPKSIDQFKSVIFKRSSELTTPFHVVFKNNELDEFSAQIQLVNQITDDVYVISVIPKLYRAGEENLVLEEPKMVRREPFYYERHLNTFEDLFDYGNNFKYAESIAHMGSFQHDIKTGICKWSDELYRICGYKPQSFVPGRDMFLSVFHPEDRLMEENAILDALEKRSRYKHECRIVRPSGEIRYVISMGQVISGINNEPIEIKGALQDITELKKTELSLQASEENYRMLFESVPVGLAISDSAGKIIYGNKKSRILLEISRTELKQGVIDLSRWKFINKNGTEISKEDLPNMKVFRQNRTIENSEIGIIKENKQLTWFNVTATPLQQNDQILIAFIDITKQVIRENDLKLLSEKLKELNATKDKFFSIIAHDLKNPFNSILGFSELLLKNMDKYDTEDIERFIGIINNTSQNAYNLLENLLNWSRSQTGTIEFNPGNYRLTEIILSNIEFVENTALKKNIRILFDVPGNPVVEIDKNMIDTVFRNLLTNAIKFSYPGGKILITIESQERFYLVSVQDNGIGIEEENIEKLFRIDSKYSSYGTNQEKGSGLGLIICKEFIERNGGQIWANSEFGKGSEFYFTLPKARTKRNL